MKKISILSLFLALFLMSCGGSTSNQQTDSQSVEEVLKLDSLSTELETTINEIDQSESELDAALDELND